MKILGIGGMGYRDSASALVVDGKLVAAASEERLARRRHAGGFPRRAAAYCLDAGGIDWGDLTVVAIANNPWIRLREQVVDWYGESFFESTAFKVHHIFHDEIRDLVDYLKAIEDLKQKHGLEVEVVPHHMSHLAASFYLSGWDEAALLNVDGRAVVSTSAAGVGSGTEITVHHREEMPNSLGLLYAAVTDFLGFHETNDEFRVMSISSLGEPAYVNQIRELVHLGPDGTYALNPEYFAYHEGRAFLSDRFSDVFGESRAPGESITDRHRDLAASLQRLLVDTALHVARSLKERTGLDRLCLSGGVAQNWVFNGSMVREGPFEEVRILPTAADTGTAAGAALNVAFSRGATRGPGLCGADLGPSFTDDECEKVLAARCLPIARVDDAETATADLLASDRIVGRFAGRMEFGPRTLGMRSILADPTRADTRERLVAGVKHRERYHPFGMSLPEERVGDWFESPRRSPYMLFYGRVKEARREQLPAVLHVDGTARYHTVSKDTDPAFHRLLLEFEKRRGVPVLLNTSLNRPGEPVACSPGDALDCFWGSGLEALVLGKHVLEKADVLRQVPADGSR
jgi:carbamoyltransferase